MKGIKSLYLHRELEKAMRLLTSTVFLLPFLAFDGVISSEDALQSTTGVWQSEQEINITHELVGESIVQSTTKRSDVTTAESDLNNMSQKNTTENNLSEDNITKVIVGNDSALENDTGNKYISKNDGENTDQGTTESISFDLERTTTVTNVLINQETTIVPPKDISLEDSSNVQNSGQMVNKTKAESTPTDSISLNDQSSSNSRNSTPRRGRNGNDRKERLQPLPLSYKNKQRFSGHQKSLAKDYLFPDKSKSIDLFGIFKLILEKETLELDSKILDFMQSASNDKSFNSNVIPNIIALCAKSKGLSSRAYDLARNWYNQPIPLLQPGVLPKAALAEYLVSDEQPIESTWLPVGSNLDTPMLDTRDLKEFETSLIDIYETEGNPLTEMASNNPSRIDHLRPCWKTQRNCSPLGDKILCKSKVICKSPVIRDKGAVTESGVYNLHKTVSNLEHGIPNSESGILSLETAIHLLKNLIPFLKNSIPLLQNVTQILKNAIWLRKDQRFKYAGYKDEMDGVEAKVLSDDISQADSIKPGILTSKGSTTEIISGTIAALPTNDSSPSYANSNNDGKPIFDTDTIDDATRSFSTSKPENTNLTVGITSASDNLNSLNKLLNNLSSLNALSSSIYAGSSFAKGDHGDRIEGNKDESAGSKRSFTSEPITGGSDTLPTLSVSTKPLSVSMNQSVLNEITPTSKSAEPVESGPVATAKQSETIYPSIGQLVSLSNQSNEGSLSHIETNSRQTSADKSLVNQKYQSANLERKVGTINTILDRIVNTNTKNLNSDLNISAISKINNVLKAAGMNPSRISVDNSLKGIRQSLKTKPKSTNSEHVRLNLNQDSNVNIKQYENVSKLESGSVEQPMQEPIKMQLPVSSQAEHQSPLSGNTGIAGWNAKQDGSLNENRTPKTNVNQNVNTNQVNIAGLTHGVNPMLASLDMNVNSINDINRIIPDGDLNMVGNLGLSRRTNSDVGFLGQQISEGQTLAQGVSVGDAVSANTNLNYNSKVNSDYNANLRQGDSLKMPESIRDIPTPEQSSVSVAVVQKGGKIKTNPHNNDGVDSNFRAHANFKLNLGSGFGILKNMLPRNPILSGGIISRRIMNLTPKDHNLQHNGTNQKQNKHQDLNLNQTQYLNENQNPYQSQNRSTKQIQNSKEYLNQNLNPNLNANLDQDENQYESEDHVSNQFPNQNKILYQKHYLNDIQNINRNLNQNRNFNENQNSNQNKNIENSNQYSNENLNADLNQKENKTQNQKRNQIQEKNAINYENQNSNPHTNQNLNKIDIQTQNQILNHLRKQDQVQNQIQPNKDHSLNKNLNQELNLEVNSNLDRNQLMDQIQNQNKVHSQNANQYLSQNQNQNLYQNVNQYEYSNKNLNQELNQNINPRLNKNQFQDQLQNQNQVQNQISNQYLSQNKNVNQNLNQDLNQDLNDNGYQNQVQNQNQIKQKNTNEYLSQNQNQNQNLNNNMSQDQYSNQSLNQEQIQNQYQFHKRNANQYLNQNQNVNQNMNQDINENLNTKQNLNSNDSEYLNHIQTQNQINQQNANQYLRQNGNLIHHLSQNLNRNLNLKETPGLNQNHKQYENEIQIQGQSKNEIKNQHFSSNENQNVKPIINENQNLNQIQTQYLKQDLIQNFTPNHNSNKNLVQNLNQNQIQTSDVKIPHKSGEKKKGWYELWYNEGEGKDDWIELWNNKTYKRFRRETNHRFY